MLLILRNTLGNMGIWFDYENCPFEMLLCKWIILNNDLLNLTKAIEVHVDKYKLYDEIN